MNTQKQKTIFFDLDGTLTIHSTWYALNVRLGITPEEDRDLFERYLKGGFSYDLWTASLVEIYRARSVVTRSDIVALAQSVELRSDAQEVVNALTQKGYHIVILSGSVDTIVETIAKRLGVTEWYSTSRLVFNENDQLVDIIASGDEAPAKDILAKRYAQDEGVVLADCYTIDDGGNGLELFKNTQGILLGDNEMLKPFAKHVVATLSEIPALI
mgnify:CR=1 FL=1